MEQKGRRFRQSAVCVFAPGEPRAPGSPVSPSLPSLSHRPATASSFPRGAARRRAPMPLSPPTSVQSILLSPSTITFLPHRGAAGEWGVSPTPGHPVVDGCLGAPPPSSLDLNTTGSSLPGTLAQRPTHRGDIVSPAAADTTAEELASSAPPQAGTDGPAAGAEIGSVGSLTAAFDSSYSEAGPLQLARFTVRDEDAVRVSLCRSGSAPEASEEGAARPLRPQPPSPRPHERKSGAADTHSTTSQGCSPTPSPRDRLRISGSRVAELVNFFERLGASQGT